MMYTIYKNNIPIIASNNNNNMTIEQLTDHYKKFYGEDIEIREEHTEPSFIFTDVERIKTLQIEERISAIEAATNFLLGL